MAISQRKLNLIYDWAENDDSELAKSYMELLVGIGTLRALIENCYTCRLHLKEISALEQAESKLSEVRDSWAGRISKGLDL